MPTADGVSERLAIGARIEELKRPEAEQRKVDGGELGRASRYGGLASSSSGGSQEETRKRDRRNETAALAAEAVGVLVPPALASTVFAGLTLYLADQARANGGALTPEARTLLRDLHKAAQGIPADSSSSRGSDPAPSATLTTRDVAAVLGCTRRWATRLLSSGRIEAWRSGRDWATTAASLDRYRYGDRDTA